MWVDSNANPHLTVETQRKSTFLRCRLGTPSIASTRLPGTPDPLRWKCPVEPPPHCGGVGSAPTGICPTGKTKTQRSISVKRVGRIVSGKKRVHECVWRVLFSTWLSTRRWWQRIARLTKQAMDAKRRKGSRNNPGRLLAGSFQQVKALLLSEGLKDLLLTQSRKHKRDRTLPSRFFGTMCRAWPKASRCVTQRPRVNHEITLADLAPEPPLTLT